jgi:hypothetical protein
MDLEHRLRPWRPALRVAGWILGSFLVFAVVVLFLGKDTGEACDSRLSCPGLRTFCLHAPGESYCSLSCDADGDCPEHWTCEDAPFLHRGDLSMNWRKVCLRPGG